MATRDAFKNLLSVSRRLAWTFFFSFLVLDFINEMAMAQPATSRALKLAVEAKGQSIQIGDTADIEIVLRDANNQAIKTSKDITIEINARVDSQMVHKQEVTIKAGSSSQKLRLPLKETGLIYVWANHKELLTGGIDILVKKPKPVPRAPVPRAGTRILRMEEPLSPVSQPKPLLTLRYSPQRRFLADGEDRATIQAFILNADEIIADSIRIRLFNSAGEMIPKPLVISKGQDVGSAFLTSDQPNNVTVEFLSATPAAELPGDKKLQIPFAPPITRLELKASPPNITLADKAELIVRLLGSDNSPVSTDEQRLISLAIESGRGEIEAKQPLAIEPGKFEGRTTFLPTWRGEVMISASTPNLPTDTFPLEVTLPVLLLILSALGGLAGGVIAFWVGKDSKWWRIAIGLIAGFVLYWAFIFGVLTVLPRAAVLNPLSAFALSTLGGWLGTEAFTQILKRLGLVTSVQTSSKKKGR